MPYYDLTSTESGVVMATRANNRLEALEKLSAILGVQLVQTDISPSPYLLDERFENLSTMNRDILVTVQTTL